MSQRFAVAMAAGVEASVASEQRQPARQSKESPSDRFVTTCVGSRTTPRCLVEPMPSMYDRPEDSDAEFPRMRSLYFRPPFAYCITIKYILPYTGGMGRAKVWTGTRRVMAPGDIKFNVDIRTRHTNNEGFFSRELKSTRLVPSNNILYPRPEEGFDEKGR